MKEIHYIVVRTVDGKRILHKEFHYRDPHNPFRRFDRPCMSARMSAKMTNGEVWIVTPALCMKLP